VIRSGAMLAVGLHRARSFSMKLAQTCDGFGCSLSGIRGGRWVPGKRKDARYRGFSALVGPLDGPQ